MDAKSSRLNAAPLLKTSFICSLPGGDTRDVEGYSESDADEPAKKVAATTSQP